MKGLNQFVEFNWNAFAKDKVFIAKGISEYVDFKTKEHLGTKVDGGIAEDNTQYVFKDNEEFSNVFETITFKVSKDIKVPIGVRIIPVNAKAVVYGDARNMLSVKCDDIQIVTPKEK